MILNRLSTAIQNQNWFTVILEILIVVIGIFLGLQVNDWNEERKYRQQESVYLEKIQDDLSKMRADLTNKYEGYERRITFMIRALDALESCDNSDDAVEAVEYSMQAYQAGPPLDYIGATYEEMVASGALARI